MPMNSMGKQSANYSSITQDLGRGGNVPPAVIAKKLPSRSPSENAKSRSPQKRPPNSRTSPVAYRQGSGRVPTSTASRASDLVMIHGRVSGQMGANSGPLVRLANSGNKMNRYVPSTETLASNEYKFIIDLPASERSVHYGEVLAKARQISVVSERRSKHMNIMLLIILPIVVLVVVFYINMKYHAKSRVRNQYSYQLYINININICI